LIRSMLNVADKNSKQRSATPTRDSKAPRPAAQLAPPTPIISSTLGLGLLGGLLLWAAFPPINLPWLAWIAPLPWLWLARQPRLPGWRPYVVLWFCGAIHWLLMLEGIRLAHPALYAGWIALSAYLGVYLPVFVGLTRVAVHRLKASIVVAAPIVWVGLELIRGHLITGFSMGLLAHTQAEFPRLMQISDLAGGYTLSFVIMLSSTCLLRMLMPFLASDLRSLTSLTWWPLAPAAAALTATLLYGHWRLSQTPPGAAGPTARVALIQGSLDTVFTELTAERMQETYDHYRRLTAEAVERQPNLDLVAWPESMFVISETLIEEPLAPQNGLSADEARKRLETVENDFRTVLASEAARANANTDPAHGTRFLIGTTSVAFGKEQPRYFNSALLTDRSGNIIGRYYKMHPVMFGEYVPFAEYVSWLNRVTPIAVGLSGGDGPKIFDVANLKLSPSICFESTIPHLIRGQLRELTRRGTPADVLINLTNDGWFWGSGMLDLHFRCGIFRAVENRKPLLIVANTGISAFVDGSGIVRQRGPRRQAKALLAEVQADGRPAPYQAVGDWPAWLCAAACIGLAVLGARRPLAA
jgi:apolipoprotein N-acyltransferase